MIFFHGHRLWSIDRRLLRLENRVETIYQTVVVHQELKKMVASSFEELRELVRHSTSVQASAAALLKDLAGRLADMANHPDAAQIKQLSDELRQHAQELGEAIAMASTDSGGAPVPVPDEDDEPIPGPDEEE